jgi:hypothetical protein
MTACELIENLKRMGAVLTLEAGERIKFQIPESAAPLMDLLARQKADVICILKAHGGRIATFPHCPHCASYALYRKDNIGSFECLTCGLQAIDEVAARRTN